MSFTVNFSHSVNMNGKGGYRSANSYDSDNGYDRESDNSFRLGRNNGDGYSGPTELVAPNKQSRIWGDPHIEDANGGKYDFQQRGIYNLLEDKGVSLNAKLSGQDENGPTYATKAGLTVNGNKVKVGADGAVTITDKNGRKRALEDGETYQLGKGSYITKDGDQINVGTPEYKIKFNTNQEHDGNQYMDIGVDSKDGGVALDGRKPTGLLGETFNEDGEPQTEPQQDDAAYQRNSLFKPSKSKKAQSSGYSSGTHGADSASKSGKTNSASNDDTTTDESDSQDGTSDNSSDGQGMQDLLKAFLPILKQLMQLFKQYLN